MKKLILVFAILVGVGLATLLPASTRNLPQSEEANVRACIEHYFLGHSTGNGEHFRRAFHPDAKLFFIRDGKVTQWTLRMRAAPVESLRPTKPSASAELRA